MKIEEISGIEDFVKESEKIDENKSREVYKVDGRAFVVANKNTIEVRTDEKLGKLLREKYESVMESRYFGRGGIEIVNSGQLKPDEIEDLVRLSYNLTKEIE
ncbi:MmcQ/YjbR family DNA-binding protein [Candidatus Saccharibacteria bacterium]|nr:MmcQ/YjbR family DNA-binding protein [Candidatus Saccharibacteria bacterium]